MSGASDASAPVDPAAAAADAAAAATFDGAPVFVSVEGFRTLLGKDSPGNEISRHFDLYYPQKCADLCTSLPSWQCAAFLWIETGPWATNNGVASPLCELKFARSAERISFDNFNVGALYMRRK
jgi:hypothetical protein